MSGRREMPDTVPMEIPAGFRKPETMEEIVQRLVRRQVSEAADARGDETFEESEDFEIDDMFDPSSPYEEVFDPVLQRGITLDEFRKNEATYRQRYEDAHARAFNVLDSSTALRSRGLKREAAEGAAVALDGKGKSDSNGDKAS